VAPAAPATPVSEQLAAAEPPKPVPTGPSMPTGMGARSAPSTRGRGRGPIGARVGAPPAHLLSIGVVETSRPSSAAPPPEPIVTESVPDLPVTGEDALATAGDAPKAARKRGAREDAKPRRPRKPAHAEGDKAAPRRGARKSRSKTAGSE
jgi:hypothetical protein